LKHPQLQPSRHLYEEIYLSVAQWTDVLDLAHMWDFDQMRKVAIKKLSEARIDPMQKIVIAHKYEIEEWYEGAYVALAQRDNPLTVEEARTVGFEFAIKMAQVREKSYSAGSSTCGTPKSLFGNETCTAMVTSSRVGELDLNKLLE
jgi:hypothetical protein